MFFRFFVSGRAGSLVVGGGGLSGGWSACRRGSNCRCGHPCPSCLPPLFFLPFVRFCRQFAGHGEEVNFRGEVFHASFLRLRPSSVGRLFDGEGELSLRYSSVLVTCSCDVYFPNRSDFFCVLVNLPIVFPFHFSCIVRFFVVPFYDGEICFRVPFRPRVEATAYQRRGRGRPCRRPFLGVGTKTYLCGLVQFCPPVSVRIQQDVPVPRRHRCPVALFRFFSGPFRHFFLHPNSYVDQVSPNIRPAGVTSAGASLVPSSAVDPRPYGLSPKFRASVRPCRVIVSCFIRPPNAVPAVCVFDTRVRSHLHDQAVGCGQVSFPRGACFLELVVQQEGAFSAPSCLAFLCFQLLLYRFCFVTASRPPRFVFLLLP